ncbi:MAG: hypothetical protein LBL26_01090 [Peptococcaceae bacterium]|nr:hypothetical protein [Peptococcaceae bacterium]
MDNLLSIVVIIVVALANFAVQRATAKQKRKNADKGAGPAAFGGEAESADQAGAEVYAQTGSAERARPQVPANPGASADSAWTDPARAADSAWTGNSSRQRLSPAEFRDMTGAPRPQGQGGRAVQGRPPAPGGRAAQRGAPIVQGGTSAQGSASVQGRAPAQGGASAQGGRSAQGGASAQGAPAGHGAPPPIPRLLFAQPAPGGAVPRQEGRAAAAAAVPVIPKEPAPQTRETRETPAAEPKAAAARAAAWRFGDISQKSLAYAVVWSEILGAPRALRPFSRR